MLHKFAAAAIVAVLGLAAGSADAQTYKFKTPQDAKKWKSVTQDWQIKDQRFSPKITEPAALPVALLKESDVIDGEFTFAIEGLGQYNAAGLVRGFVEGKRISGYVAFLARGEGGVLSASISRWTGLNPRNPGGNDILLCDGVTAETGKSGKLTVRAVGTSLDVYINGVFACGIDDAMAMGGTVGLIESFPGSGRPASFKSVSIRMP